ncbi:hypothetical protein D3C76_1602260 [compost metagenome]
MLVEQLLKLRNFVGQFINWGGACGRQDSQAVHEDGVARFNHEVKDLLGDPATGVADLGHQRDMVPTGHVS